MKQIKKHYDDIIDLLIIDKIPVNYILEKKFGNGGDTKSMQHIGIITKRINSLVIINDFTLKLNKFHEIFIYEMITEQVKYIYPYMIISEKNKKIGYYNLRDDTLYNIDDYIIYPKKDKTTYINREINIDFID